MNFKDMYKTKSKKEIWEHFCGFLDLSIDEFMAIQNRLMSEQLQLWKKSGLGQSLLKTDVDSIEQFRREFKLTDYKDYADILFLKQDDMLPEKAVIWIKTTWEGGKHTIKIAPYTSSMIDTFKDNVFACMILATSKSKYHYDIDPNNTFLYGLAPLPYATGLLPRALSMNVDIDFLPEVESAEKMSFSERNKLGFKLGLQRGIDYFFGLSSVAYYISKSFGSVTSSGNGNSESKARPGLKIAYRYLKSRSLCKLENRDMLPKDLFRLKGFMITGTDTACYKDELEQMWGIKPLEVFAGTEPTCIGCEDYERNGMYFFPDACYYEFIKEEDMYKCLDDSDFNPRTYLFNEVEPGEQYELVISVLKGGAFMRYRVKDVYKCVGKNEKGLPRFRFVDRAPDVIDIAGFTRISKEQIDMIIELSKLDISNYVITKEYNEDNKPLLHMYVELDDKSLLDSANIVDVLQGQLGIYFRYLDSDYCDLKKILNMEPLEITVLRCGTFSKFEEVYGRKIRSFNPSRFDIIDLVDIQCRVGEYRGINYD